MRVVVVVVEIGSRAVVGRVVVVAVVVITVAVGDAVAAVVVGWRWWCLRRGRRRWWWWCWWWLRAGSHLPNHSGTVGGGWCTQGGCSVAGHSAVLLRAVLLDSTRLVSSPGPVSWRVVRSCVSFRSLHYGLAATTVRLGALVLGHPGLVFLLALCVR